MGSRSWIGIGCFNVETVSVLKGPSSLLYGSDAMGGVIDIQQAALPVADQFSRKRRFWENSEWYGGRFSYAGL